MTTKTTTPNEKINKAMNLVNQAKNQKMDATKENLKDQWETGKEKATEYREEMTAQFNRGREATTKSFKENPFYFLAGATFVGILLGLLFGKRK